MVILYLFYNILQALLIRERILGADHKDTIFGLMYRGAGYADLNQYRRCIALWKHAFRLRHAKQVPLNHECLFTLQVTKYFDPSTIISYVN